MAESESVCGSGSGYDRQSASKLRAGAGNDSIGFVHLPDVPHGRRKVDPVTWRIVQPSEPPESRASHSCSEPGHVREDSERHQWNQWLVRWGSTHHTVCFEVCVLASYCSGVL